MPTRTREYDVALMGASGFVGALVAEHLARRAPADLRVALAGRSRDRLGAVRDTLPGIARGWPLVEVDAVDEVAVERLAARARVVVSTVGPYLRFGAALVRACARAGTHYADLTGEALFAARSVVENHEAAVASGARVVHSCGFDSVPSDLGVMLTARRAAADEAGTLTDATLVVVAARGGFSGGTIDSMRAQVDQVAAEPSLARRLADPYLLSPDREAEPDLGRQPDFGGAERLDDGSWAAPFAMASFNTRIVRRSNTLQGWAYGREMRYREVVRTGRSPLSPLVAAGMTVGLAGVMRGMRGGVARRVLDRVLPAPGTGPSEGARRAGYFRVDVRARTTSGRRYVTKVSAKGDPGYAATAVMLGESALALALDPPLGGGGVLTPAVALGSPLVERLRECGFRFETYEADAPSPA